MAHIEQKAFCESVKTQFPDFFKNKRVLDIGSLDINGANKELFEDSDYIGIDVGEGNNVDVPSIGHLYDAPDNYFDVIISTETFEHDMFYEKTIGNIIRMLKPGGLFLFTCAAPGRPEHGTRRSGSEFDAPLLSEISDDWADYYKNLIPDDFHSIPLFNKTFPDGYFEIKSTEIAIPSDLYFYGFKGGEKYINTIEPEYSKEDFQDHIFVIDSWPDNESKENDLVNLIKQLKVYNIPILLTGHYAIKPEIQKMVDYYLYDKNNPVLFNNEFDDYGVNSARWTNLGEMVVNNYYPFHHDYAIWETMRNAFNFCDYLGKKFIHFMEYDNLPDIVQYRQAFLERIKDFDAILYEYDEDSISKGYSSAYIFSIRTDVGMKAIDTIKSREEYFINKPDGWQLEKTLLKAIKSVTNRVHISEYLPNDEELNTQAVWARDGINRNGGRFQIYLAVDAQDSLYLHAISGFYEKKADKHYLLEVNYGDHEKFHILKKDDYLTEYLGKYKKGTWVRVYYEGIEVYKEFLGDNVENFRKFNTITKKGEKIVKEEKIVKVGKLPKPSDDIRINYHFLNGPFIEILESGKNKYRVQFINTDTGIIEYDKVLSSNHYATANIKYYANWVIKIQGIDVDFNFETKFNPKGQRFLIGFGSKSLGDTLSWIPYVEKFMEEKQCKVICSTFLNDLLIKQYPKIEFVSPGTVVNNLYGSYSIGLFFKTDKPTEFNDHKNPSDARKIPLGKIASDILGVEYEEIKPRIYKHNVKKKKQVAIGIHSTAQCKYWNNPTGWQEVVDYLKSKDYKVILLSREEDGYMGNKNPRGVVKHKKGPLKHVIRTIQESEMFIGISGGLSWLSWAAGTPTILISGFTERISEPQKDIHRVINESVCHGCWSEFKFDPGNWFWCPRHDNTDRKFECSKLITSKMVIKEIDKIIKENK